MKARADYWNLVYPLLKGVSHVESEEAMGQGEEWKREKGMWPVGAYQGWNGIFPQNREGRLKRKKFDSDDSFLSPAQREDVDSCQHKCYSKKRCVWKPAG